MNKFTKIVAALAMAAAVLSCAACSNNGTSSESSSAASDAAKTSEASTVSTADASTVSTAEASTAVASTAEVQAPATAEASAFDVSVMYGTWALTAIDAGNGAMSVADYAASIGADAESCMQFVTIDENGYTSSNANGESTFAYTATENGLTFEADGVVFTVTYDAELDSIMYGVNVNDVTYKYLLIRYNADDAASATAQASATAEAAVAATAEAAE
ncbi:unknown [Eubacterium sp. CAG:786]|nr:unknown [Eubacterium sp. CAG:786]